MPPGQREAVRVKDGHLPRGWGDPPCSPPLDKGSNRKGRKATQSRILKHGKNQQVTFFEVTVLAGNEGTAV